MKYLVWTEEYSDDVRANGTCLEFIAETNEEVDSAKWCWRYAYQVLRQFQRDGVRAWIEFQPCNGALYPRYRVTEWRN